MGGLVADRLPTNLRGAADTLNLSRVKQPTSAVTGGFESLDTTGPNHPQQCSGGDAYRGRGGPGVDKLQGLHRHRMADICQICNRGVVVSYLGRVVY